MGADDRAGLPQLEGDFSDNFAVLKVNTDLVAKVSEGFGGAMCVDVARARVWERASHRARGLVERIVNLGLVYPRQPLERRVGL